MEPTGSELTPTFSKYDAAGVAKASLANEEFLRSMLAEAAGVDVDAAMGKIVGGCGGGSADSSADPEVLWKEAYSRRWATHCPVPTVKDTVIPMLV